ncbi:hypothetical protein [Flagellimonas sp.]|uniref:hypothetical protein n=1 Tax=Flagellimonas sp. TaxID=2058762 RepID=UPI003BA8DC99
MTCLLSCKAQKEGAASVGEEIEDLVLVDHDNFTNIDSFETRVIRDIKSLRKFYSQINQTRKPGLPVPTVDFSQHILVLVCLGEQQGETVPLISKLKETEVELTMAVELSKKGSKGDMSNQMVYFPFYLYKLPLVDKAITFQRVDH